MLKVEHLSTGYQKRQVLFDISFEVQQKEIVLLIGSNGSGKSTLLRAIYGLLPLWDAKETMVQFADENITGIRPHKLIKNGLVYVSQKNNSFEHLTVKENLEVAAIHFQSTQITKQRLDEVFDLLPVLSPLQKKIPFHLSGGEKQALALGMALVQKPKMILLDEPGAGLSIDAWQKALKIIQVLNGMGITFLIVEHKLKESYLIANRVISLKLGSLFKTYTTNSNFTINNLHEVFI